MPTTTYRVLFLGDFHFGESYKKAGATILEKHGYEHSLKHLTSFVEAADHFVLNLETPLVDPVQHPSPLTGRKKYIHWADTQSTPRALTELGVDAVSLANNHTLDHGAEGLLSSFEVLSEAGIPWFGAGRNTVEADTPYLISLPDTVGGGKISVNSMFQYSKSHDKGFHFYASAQAPGCSSLRREVLKQPRLSAPNSFHIAFPHWGANYKWRTEGQQFLATQLLEDGYDLILGHGSHAVQELTRAQRRWVVYSIGNGNFQSGGRFDSFVEEHGILPYSLWSMLEITRRDNGDREVSLKLYPVYSDNTKTDFQPRPVSETDFNRLVSELTRRAPTPQQFENDTQYTGSDQLGHFIHLKLSDWPVGAAPKRLGRLHPPIAGKSVRPSLQPSPVATDQEGRRYDDEETRGILKHYGRGKNLGALLCAAAAVKSGASVDWVTPGTAIATHDQGSYLVNGYKCDESDFGARVVQDKYILKRLLQDREVPTPDGDIAQDEDQAVAVFHQLDGPVVVKPRSGHKGEGISVDLRSPDEVRDAFRRASKVAGGVLVEEYIKPATEYRCLATHQECVSVVNRILPNVSGDGISTLRELIVRKNEARKLNPALFKRYIPIDAVTEAYLARNGFTLDSVLERSQNVTVRNVGGLSSGGEPHEYFDSVDDEVKAVSHAAVGAVPGLSWGGVDLITAEADGRPFIIEINSDADISGAMYPLHGEPKDIAGVMRDLRLGSLDSNDRAEPEIPAATAPTRVASVTDHFTKPGSRLATGLFKSLSENGYTLETLGPGLYRALSVDEAEEPIWLTSEAMGPQDLSAVRRAMRRHVAVRRILEHRGVPTVSATIAKTPAAVEEFRSTSTSGTAIVPTATGEWNGTNCLFAPLRGEGEGELQLPGKSPWIVQNHDPDTRLRAIATRRGLAVCFSNSSVSFTQESIDHIANIAVSAVHAIPQLRWAAVDLAPASGSSFAVEGMTVNPLIDPQSSIIAGSFNQAYTAINEKFDLR